MKIAILGGTGPEGGGLGLRWAQAGHEVIVGSRQAEKGERVAEELKSRLPETARQRLTGTDNLAAIQQADIAVLAVPYSGQERTLAGLEAALAGKLLLTVVVPLGEKAAACGGHRAAWPQPKRPASSLAKALGWWLRSKTSRPTTWKTPITPSTATFLSAATTRPTNK